MAFMPRAAKNAVVALKVGRQRDAERRVEAFAIGWMARRPESEAFTRKPCSYPEWAEPPDLDHRILGRTRPKQQHPKSSRLACRAARYADPGGSTSVPDQGR